MITLYLLFKLLCRIRVKPARTVTKRTVKKTYSARNQKPADLEKQRRQAEKAKIEQFKRYQAEQDIIHYTQVKADLLKAYDAARADGDSEKAIRKRIAYDNAIRRTEKQIENAAYNATRTG